jgi:hypothetical protein
MRAGIDGRTALLTAACIGLVLAPLGVEAATDNVVLKDAHSDKKATVSRGALRVGDGDGPLTINGRVRVTNQTQRVEVVTPNEPANRSNLITNVATAEAERLTAELPPEGRYLLSTVTVANDGPDPVTIVVSAAQSVVPGACDGGEIAILSRVRVPGNETVHVAYPDHVQAGPYLQEEEGWCLITHLTPESPVPDPGVLWVQITGLG